MFVFGIRYTIRRMETFRPLKAANISEQAYESVEAAIVRCEIGPGTVLSDRQLAEVLGISRTPVREVLQRLEFSGLVKRRGRVGWMVAGFDQRDARELSELRQVLEPLGIRRLSETWDDATVEELSGFFEGFPDELSRDMYAGYLRRDHEFHKRIVEWSDNGRVIYFYGVVEKQINRIRHYLAPRYEGRFSQIVEEHRRICEAIAARDAGAANEALLHHLRMGSEAMTRLVKEHSEQWAEERNSSSSGTDK